VFIALAASRRKVSSVIIPPSPHFTPLDLSGAFNADRARLDGGLSPRTGPGVVPDWSLSEAFGARVFHGIPFALGERDRPNVVLLGGEAAADRVRIDLEPTQASYLVFLHAVEDRQEADLDGFGAIGPTPPAGRNAGNTLGGHVADYVLVYEDGRETATPILRRFAIQQRHISWGASPFAAIPALGPVVFTTGSDDSLLERALVQDELPVGDVERVEGDGAPPVGQPVTQLQVADPEVRILAVARARGQVVELVDPLVVSGGSAAGEQAEGKEDPRLRPETLRLDQVLERPDLIDLDEVEVLAFVGVLRAQRQSLADRAVEVDRAEPVLAGPHLDVGDRLAGAPDR